MNRFQLAGAAFLICVPSIAIAQTSPASTDMKPAATRADSPDSEDAAKTKMADTTATAASSDMFTSVPANGDLSSKMVGLAIYNNQKQDIGSIKDIAFGPDGVKAYIVGVGGFLGMGDHYVAVRPSSIKLTYDAGDKTWHAMMDANAEQLKAAPEYKYAS